MFSKDTQLFSGWGTFSKKYLLFILFLLPFQKDLKLQSHLQERALIEEALHATILTSDLSLCDIVILKFLSVSELHL